MECAQYRCVSYVCVMFPVSKICCVLCCICMYVIEWVKRVCECLCCMSEDENVAWWEYVCDGSWDERMNVAAEWVENSMTSCMNVEFIYYPLFYFSLSLKGIHPHTLTATLDLQRLGTRTRDWGITTDTDQPHHTNWRSIRCDWSWCSA